MNRSAHDHDHLNVRKVLREHATTPAQPLRNARECNGGVASRDW